MGYDYRMDETESQILIYQTQDGHTRIETRMVDETVWLSLNQMAELFQRDKSVISRHIGNVFREGELVREAVVAEFAATAADGKTCQVAHFVLEVLISVAYPMLSRLQHALAECNELGYSIDSKPTGPLARASAARSIRWVFLSSGGCHAL